MKTRTITKPLLGLNTRMKNVIRTKTITIQYPSIIMVGITAQLKRNMIPITQGKNTGYLLLRGSMNPLKYRFMIILSVNSSVPFLIYSENVEMKELKKEHTATPISRLKYDMDDGTLRSRNRRGWAPSNDRGQDELPPQRPLSFAGS